MVDVMAAMGLLAAEQVYGINIDLGCDVVLEALAVDHNIDFSVLIAQPYATCIMASNEGDIFYSHQFHYPTYSNNMEVNGLDEVDRNKMCFATFGLWLIDQNPDVVLEGEEIDLAKVLVRIAKPVF